jgi:exopolyphosphatase/guanosine-5'-triphosphate,3'-diphosphate pyrophosphatase
MNIGIIDIGTNTTRLLVKDPKTNLDILRQISLTRLGENLETNGCLSQEAMVRTKNQVEKFVSIAHANEVEIVKIFATAGCRQSSNGQEFIDSLNSIEKAEATIIDGEAEAQFSFKGALGGFDMTNVALPVGVIDIGGGSTEIAVSNIADPNECNTFVSIPIGSAKLIERYIHSDPPLPEELTNAIGDVRDSLSNAMLENPIISKVKSFIGVAATFTTSAAVEIGLKEFSFERLHGYVLTRGMVEEIFRTLVLEDLESRKFNPGLEPERAQLIVGGLCILVAIVRQFNLSQISVSCTDLLDGLYKGELANQA